MTVIEPEMISSSITMHDVLPLSFLKKSVYTGSKAGMRYRMEKAEVPDEAAAKKTAEKAGAEQGQQPSGKPEEAASEEIPMKTVLLVSIWPEPLAFAETDAAGIEKEIFSFSKDGIEQAVAWLNGQLPRFSADAPR